MDDFHKTQVPPVYKQINTVSLIQMDFLVDYRNRFLSFKAQPKLPQFISQARFVSCLQQSRP